MEVSPSGLPMDEATAAPSLSTEAGAEDGYFSLLDMFVWTRWVDTGHLVLVTCYSPLQRRGGVGGGERGAGPHLPLAAAGRDPPPADHHLLALRQLPGGQWTIVLQKVPSEGS